MVMLPNGATLMSLFFGIFSIVSASRGEFSRAVWCILVSGICDAIDGRVARATGTSSKFGAELDSLVDAIAFGLAPAMLMYFAVLRHDGWDWVLVFLFAACAVMRLARFNVEQAGSAKKYFRGLPSPAAGGILASFWWFSQTPVYVASGIGDLPWRTVVRILMAGLAFLMISNVPYLAWPTFSVKTVRGVAGLLAFIGLGIGLVFLPQEFFFPVGFLYVLFGLVTTVLRGLLDRPPIFDDTDAPPPELPYDLSDLEEDDEDDDEEDVDDDDEDEDERRPVAPPPVPTSNTRKRRRRRRPRGTNPNQHPPRSAPEGSQ
jgi:CDP-diacylglycerol--serine O-phosphatidyltransferase